MSVYISNTPLEKLYTEDYYLWLENTLELLKQHQVENLDWQHLIEEIEALGNEQRRKVKSYLRQLLIHLLLYQYWTQEKDYCSKGWKDEIGNFRYELELLIESQTLYNYLIEQVDEVYTKARKQTIRQTELAASTFPEKCSFTIEDIVNSDFFPE